MTAAYSALNPANSGVYRAPSNVESVHDNLGAAALWLAVDLSLVRNKSQLLSALQGACGFAATFGHNWDALADGLQEMSCCPAPAYVLHLQHAERAAGSLGPDWATLLEVLTESADYWKAQGKPFVVFVDGPAALPEWN